MRRSGGHEVKPTSLSDTYHGRIRLDITDSPDGGVVAGIDKLCFAKDGCRLMREEEAQWGEAGNERASERQVLAKCGAGAMLDIRVRTGCSWSVAKDACAWTNSKESTAKPTQ